MGTLVLADLGAEVIKVERPIVGEDARGLTPMREGLSAPFEAVNRGKDSVAIDLKNPQGLAAARELVASADVLVESMKPGKLDSLGLGFAEVARINPSIIYCSLSGYGATGPDSHRPGYDMLMQARTGIMSITGEPGGPPIRVGPSIVDIGAGIWAAVNVLAAITKSYRTEATAQRLDVSLFDAAVTWMIVPIVQLAMSGEVPKRMGGQTPMAAPADIYATADGYMIVQVLGDDLWRRLVTRLGSPPDLQSTHWVTNAGRVQRRDELSSILRPIFAEHPTEHWVTTLRADGIPLEPIVDVTGLIEDEQTRARRMIELVEHEVLGTFPQVQLPLVNSGFDVPALSSTAPQLGRDTVKHLTGIGMQRTLVDALLEDGVIQSFTP
jgi:formyl-CoA transferase/CoA:oxalate CoA-transferase